MFSPTAAHASTPHNAGGIGGSPWGVRTPLSHIRSQAAHANTSSPSRDTLVKVTFKQVHDRAPSNACMYITGSLPSLGSWDAKRARKMSQDQEGSWSLAIYIPERAEFLYQYLMLENSDDLTKDPVVLWEGALERKCKIEEASSTPNRSIMLSDDTRGEEGGRKSVCGDGNTPVVERIASEKFRETGETLALRDRVESLEKERELCQNELQKLQEVTGLRSNASNRDSLLDDCPTHDTVKKIQTLLCKRLKKGNSATSEENVSTHICCDIEKVRADMQAEKDAMKSELEIKHRLEMGEAQEYYQKTLGELDQNQRKVAEERALKEETTTLLQSTLRVAAGELDCVQNDFRKLKEEASQLSEFNATVKNITETICGHMKRVATKTEQCLLEKEERLMKEVNERRRLHNLVQELKGNIRVFCRIRPDNDGEQPVVAVTSENDMIVDSAGKSNAFNFDTVFDPCSSQEAVFAETKALVVSVLDCYNVCIFAYGQTGSGKTHTMQGCKGAPGVNVRALESLFEMAAERSDGSSYTISVSLMEIYNESIRDLFDPKDNKGEEKKLDVKICPEGGTHVPGLRVQEVASMGDVTEFLRKGEMNRSVGSTNMNEHSSRSHMILSVYVTCCSSSGAKGYGKMHLVDLAGSERVGKSGAQGDRLKEAQNINKSLSALGDCVQSLVAKQKHIPFRNSKLTFLLQDSLGGDSKALMFVCISPSESDSGETLCSLNFASRVRNVELGPAKRKGDSGLEIKVREKERDAESARSEAKKAQESLQKQSKRIFELEKELQVQNQSVENAQSLQKELEKTLARSAELEKWNIELEKQLAHKATLRHSEVSANKDTPHRVSSETISKIPQLRKSRSGCEEPASPTKRQANNSTVAAVKSPVSISTLSPGGENKENSVSPPARLSVGDDALAEEHGGGKDASHSLEERTTNFRATKHNYSISDSIVRPTSAPVSRLSAGGGSRLSTGASRIKKAADPSPATKSSHSGWR